MKTSSTTTDTTDSSPEDSPFRDRYLTVSNVLSVLRILGAFALIPLAWLQHSDVFVGLFVFLSLTDWVDGKLARWLNQQSELGARLDSMSDSILYVCLIIGSIFLKGDVLKAQWMWIAVPLLSYAVTSLFCLWKFGKMPSYHTRMAKISQWMVLFAGVSLLLDISLVPLKITALMVTLTNIETTIMTAVLSEWHADILTLAEAIRLEKKKHKTHSATE